MGRKAYKTLTCAKALVDILWRREKRAKEKGAAEEKQEVFFKTKCSNAYIDAHPFQTVMSVI